MITDPQKIRRGDPGRPEVCNVFSYEQLFGTPAERVAEIDRTCRTGELGCRDHKDELAERIVEYLRPLRERREATLADRGELERILDRGAERAREIAVPIVNSAKRRWACERRPLALDLDVFEGPFDLLVTLILNEEIDLLEVNLAEIVLAYLERLEARGELELEAATEFLILIAALLELKSRLMLPGEEMEGLDLEPQEAVDELLHRLLEYRRHRAAAEHLRERLAAEQGFRYRSAPLPAHLRRVSLVGRGPGLPAAGPGRRHGRPAAHAAAHRHAAPASSGGVARTAARPRARAARPAGPVHLRGGGAGQ